MKRNKQDPNILKWHAKHRMQKVKTLMASQGVTVANVELMLEIIMKDKLALSETLDVKMMNVMINFLKVKQTEKQGVNPLEKALESAKQFEQED
jgi:hypothetical protein